MRKRHSKKCLDRFKRNLTEFVRGFVIMGDVGASLHARNQTAVEVVRGFGHEESHLCCRVDGFLLAWRLAMVNFELKAWHWVEVGGSAPKKAKSIASTGKNMASVFWHVKDILLIDYLEKGRPITGKYYYILLDHLDVKIREKRPDLRKEKNHLSLAQRTCSQKFLCNGDFESFISKEEVERAVDEYFNSLPDFHFLEGILILEKRWTKSMDKFLDQLRYPKQDLITSPSVKIPGFSLPRREWVFLNRFRDRKYLPNYKKGREYLHAGSQIRLLPERTPNTGQIPAVPAALICKQVENRSRFRVWAATIGYDEKSLTGHPPSATRLT
ncbi:hypothetical protein LAZ67_9002791 [Cordylochernes scorpioides]|uniref:Uncharacterized protein n=1 Tax=Cordylochernes scorpioides TaxID=51811 RepID=A0ABY6KU43_9ARAC|nr:hypothetical protein LAZ67_9002791 [Cordylochernes scorpioides]